MERSKQFLIQTGTSVLFCSPIITVILAATYTAKGLALQYSNKVFSMALNLSLFCSIILPSLDIYWKVRVSSYLNFSFNSWISYYFALIFQASFSRLGAISFTLTEKDFQFDQYAFYKLNEFERSPAKQNSKASPLKGTNTLSFLKLLLSIDSFQMKEEVALRYINKQLYSYMLRASVVWFQKLEKSISSQKMEPFLLLMDEMSSKIEDSQYSCMQRTCVVYNSIDIDTYIGEKQRQIRVAANRNFSIWNARFAILVDSGLLSSQ